MTGVLIGLKSSKDCLSPLFKKVTFNEGSGIKSVQFMRSLGQLLTQGWGSLRSPGICIVCGLLLLFFYTLELGGKDSAFNRLYCKEDVDRREAKNWWFGFHTGAWLGRTRHLGLYFYPRGLTTVEGQGTKSRGQCSKNLQQTDPQPDGPSTPESTPAITGADPTEHSQVPAPFQSSPASGD